MIRIVTLALTICLFAIAAAPADAFLFFGQRRQDINVQIVNGGGAAPGFSQQNFVNGGGGPRFSGRSGNFGGGSQGPAFVRDRFGRLIRVR